MRKFENRFIWLVEYLDKLPTLSLILIAIGDLIFTSLFSWWMLTSYSNNKLLSGLVPISWFIYAFWAIYIILIVLSRKRHKDYFKNKK